jgi:iron complex transport system substrate-binding protein
MNRAFAIGLLCLIGAAPVSAAERPHRVTSLNLCTDQLLVALADPDDIASLSPLARDPGISGVAAGADRWPDNRASAEEILREQVDLVLAEPGGAGPTVELLKRLGVRVETVPMVDRLDQIAPTVRQVADVLGQSERGDALIRAMERQLAEIPPPTERVTALLYEANGWTVGKGTLSDDVLKAAGFVNQAERLGVSGYGAVSLERLLADPPDLLIENRYRVGEISLAETLLDHPAFRHTKLKRINIPDRMLICGTPAIADAALALAIANRDEVAAQ